MPEDANNIEVPTPWGGHLKASGQQAILILLIFGLAGLALWQHSDRKHEHERLEAELLAQHVKEITEYTSGQTKLAERFDNLACLVQLNIWIRTVGVDLIENNQPLSLTDPRIPWDLWQCVPQFLVEPRRNTVIRKVEKGGKEPGPGGPGR